MEVSASVTSKCRATSTGCILGFYWGNGNENRNYHLRFWVLAVGLTSRFLAFRKSPSSVALMGIRVFSGIYRGESRG